MLLRRRKHDESVDVAGLLREQGIEIDVAALGHNAVLRRRFAIDFVMAAEAAGDKIKFLIKLYCIAVSATYSRIDGAA
ncbi:UNVERIFIED_ORG: hypothetical protein GGE55_002136 [Rhizobium esperanzae]